MAFIRTDLSGNLGAGSNAPKLFTYKSTVDTKAQIVAADYFLSAYQILEEGDMIMLYGTDGGATVHVTAATSATVTVGENSVA